MENLLPRKPPPRFSGGCPSSLVTGEAHSKFPVFLLGGSRGHEYWEQPREEGPAKWVRGVTSNSHRKRGARSHGNRQQKSAATTSTSSRKGGKREKIYILLSGSGIGDPSWSLPCLECILELEGESHFRQDRGFNRKKGVVPISYAQRKKREGASSAGD